MVYNIHQPAPPLRLAKEYWPAVEILVIVKHRVERMESAKESSGEMLLCQ